MSYVFEHYQSFLKDISNAYHENKLIFFISFSGLPNRLEASYNKKKMLKTFAMLKKKRFPFVHYWRPVTKLNSTEEAIEEILDYILPYAACSVVVGLKASRSLNRYYEKQGLIDSSMTSKEEGEHFPELFLPTLKRILEAKNNRFPVYRHASCAVSKLTHSPDYNGTMFRQNICALHDTGISLCTEEQKQICREFKVNSGKNWNEKNDKTIIEKLVPHANVNITPERIDIYTPLLQEDVILLTHLLKRPVYAKEIKHTNQYVGSILSG